MNVGAIIFPANLFVQSQQRNTRERCEICLKLTIKALERRHGRRSGDFIVNFIPFEHIAHFFLVFLFFTLKSKC